MRLSLIGKVLRVGQKTATVVVERWYTHPLYRKKYRRHKKFAVEVGDLKVLPGNLVKIVEIPKKSKTKYFKIEKILAETKLMEEVK